MDGMEKPSLASAAAALVELQTAYLEPVLERLGVGWSTFELLTAVWRTDGEVSQAEIARRLGVTPATLSESVAAHVERGLIEQVPSRTDRRRKALRLTSAGEQLVEAFGRALREAEEIMERGISERDARAAAETLRRAAANLERALEGDGASSGRASSSL